MISEAHQANFETLRQAIKNDDAALVECTYRDSGKVVMVVCAVNEGSKTEFIPLAVLFDTNVNPYCLLKPPGEDEDECKDQK